MHVHVWTKTHFWPNKLDSSGTGAKYVGLHLGFRFGAQFYFSSQQLSSNHKKNANQTIREVQSSSVPRVHTSYWRQQPGHYTWEGTKIIRGEWKKRKMIKVSTTNLSKGMDLRFFQVNETWNRHCWHEKCIHEHYQNNVWRNNWNLSGMYDYLVFRK